MPDVTKRNAEKAGLVANTELTDRRGAGSVK
jgi:hypothetical protein